MVAVISLLAAQPTQLLGSAPPLALRKADTWQARRLLAGISVDSDEGREGSRRRCGHIRAATSLPDGPESSVPSSQLPAQQQRIRPRVHATSAPEYSATEEADISQGNGVLRGEGKEVSFSTRAYEALDFVSVEEAIAVVKGGQMVLIIDHQVPLDTADMVMAASLVTEDSVAFMVKHGSGLITCPTSPVVTDRLQLPLLATMDPTIADSVAGDVNEGRKLGPQQTLNFTLTVDKKEGTTTGISAADRALTVRHLANPQAIAGDFRRPGHVIPVRCHEGGLLHHRGHAEAAVDLARLAGLPPVGVVCSLLTEEGEGAGFPELKEFAKQHQLPVLAVADLLKHRQRTETVVDRTARARLPTQWGDFDILSYESTVDGIEHVVLLKGDVRDGEDVLVRVHSECLTGDIFRSARCDCGPQLEQAIKRVEEAGRGVIVYMRGHEGRGIGLGNKLKAYNLQDLGRDTVEANIDQGLPADAREYGTSAQILRDLGVRSVRLMTNNPAKFHALSAHGINVTSRMPIFTPITLENQRYIETKRKKMGHMYTSDLGNPFGVTAVVESDIAAVESDDEDTDNLASSL